MIFKNKSFRPFQPFCLCDPIALRALPPATNALHLGGISLLSTCVLRNPGVKGIYRWSLPLEPLKPFPPLQPFCRSAQL